MERQMPRVNETDAGTVAFDDENLKKKNCVIVVQMLLIQVVD